MGTISYGHWHVCLLKGMGSDGHILTSWIVIDYT